MEEHYGSVSEPAAQQADAADEASASDAASQLIRGVLRTFGSGSVRDQSQLGVLLVLTCVVGVACGLRDVPDHVRAYRGRNRVQAGATLPTVFDELVGVREGDWPGLLAGFACEIDGKKRTRVLSRVGSGYVVITHLEDTPFAGQGDWKQIEFTDPAGVRESLSHRPSSSCESYQANIGRWAFTLALSPQTRKVQEVGPVMYHVGD